MQQELAWAEIAHWYKDNGFSEAYKAALDPYSDLRRCGSCGRIIRAIRKG